MLLLGETKRKNNNILVFSDAEDRAIVKMKFWESLDMPVLYAAEK